MFNTFQAGLSLTVLYVVLLELEFYYDANNHLTAVEKHLGGGE